MHGWNFLHVERPQGTNWIPLPSGQTRVSHWILACVPRECLSRLNHVNSLSSTTDVARCVLLPTQKCTDTQGRPLVPKELITLSGTMHIRMLRESVFAKLDGGGVGLICRSEIVPS